MAGSSENSKRVIIQTKNQGSKDNDPEKLVIIDPSYQYISESNVNINEESESHLLELEILNSYSLSIGTKIKIDELGLIEGSLRNAKDKITYFGSVENTDNNTNEKEKNADDNSIDYLIPLKHCEKFGRFFKIQFLPKLNQYIIKDLGNGLGTFIKIQDSIYLRDNTMINIGDTFLICNFLPPSEENEKNVNGKNQKLQIKLFDSKNSNEVKEFIFDNITEKKIHIGRKNHGNEIELNDKLSSKINSVIQYINEKGWILKDGNEAILKSGEIKRNNSTNGTWILANENIKIVDKLIFKSNFTVFKCNFLKY